MVMILVMVITAEIMTAASFITVCLMGFLVAIHMIMVQIITACRIARALMILRRAIG